MAIGLPARVPDEPQPRPARLPVVLLDPTTPAASRREIAVLAVGATTTSVAVLGLLGSWAHGGQTVPWWGWLLLLALLLLLDRCSLLLPERAERAVVISLADYGFVVAAAVWEPLPVVVALAVTRAVRLCRQRPVVAAHLLVEVGAVTVGAGVLCSGLTAGRWLLGDDAWSRPAMAGLASASWLIGAVVRVVLIDRYRTLAAERRVLLASPVTIGDALPFITVPALLVLAGVAAGSVGAWAAVASLPVLALLGYAAGSTAAVGVLESRLRYLGHVAAAVAASDGPEAAALAVGRATDRHFRSSATVLLMWPDGPDGPAVIVGGRRGGVAGLAPLLMAVREGATEVEARWLGPLAFELGLALHRADAVAAAPVRTGRATVGVLLCANPVAGRFAREDLDLLAAASDHLSLALRVDWLGRLYAEASSASRQDPLTGLANRSGLEVALAGGGRWTVLLIDLDDFKPVNDVHGHAAGDEVLEAVALRLRRVVQTGDVVARIGGDEFVVAHRGDLIPGLTDRIRTAVSAPVALTIGATVRVGASIGVASGDTPEAVLAAADEAMYRAKKRKKVEGRR